MSGRERFCRYLREVAGARLGDEASSFEVDLRGLATAGMATVVLKETGKEKHGQGRSVCSGSVEGG